MAVTRRLRRAVPEPLHRASRLAYVAAGARTSRWRMQPAFVMVGASRCGTTTLFQTLARHPQVQRPTVNKGVRYFDLNYQRGMDWYLGHFPLRPGHLGGRRPGTGPMTFEATGYYLYHPFAVPRLAQALPGVKVVAMLRDPVERAYSSWKHELRRGFEWEPFEVALELEQERLLGEVERMAADPSYQSFCHQHLSHRARGEYAGQLERVYASFPRDQVHVVQSEAFFAEPERELARLTAFLGLPPWQPRHVDKVNAEVSSPMEPGIRAALEAHYAPHDARLAELLGEPLAWRR